MKRNVLIGAAAGLVAIILLWFFVLYSPLGDDLKAAQDQVSTEQKKTQDLQATLARLESQKKNAPQQQALLNRLDKAVPKTPDLAEFIIQANDIADQSGIEFLTIAPSQPAAGTANGVSTINLTITIQGSFFQLQDYLQHLEKLSRLVIIDTLNVSASGGASGASAGSTGSTSGGTDLSVTLSGRMFTRAAPTGAAAGAATPGGTAGSSTSSSTTPGGSTGSTSSTSAPSGSSTTGGT
jgi:Tfp pilus assembly protein PilO